MGHGEMKGWDGPVRVEGVKDEPQGQQSREAEGYEAKDGIPHLEGLCMVGKKGEQVGYYVNNTM